ncbi:MAG: AraC family transcriptional regulator [Alkalispirochaetaceae bacterium]
MLRPFHLAWALRRRSSQFFLALAILTLLATIVSTVVVYRVAEQNYRRRVEALSLDLVAQTMTVFDTVHFGLVPNLFQLYSKNSLWPLLYSAEVPLPALLDAVEDVDGFMVAAPYLHSVIVYNSRAQLFYSTEFGRLPKKRLPYPAIQEILDNIKDYGLYTYIPVTLPGGSVGGTRPAFAIVVGHPPFRGTSMASCLIAIIDERELRQSFIASNEQERRSGTIIVDRQGRIISHPDPTYFATPLREIDSLAPVMEAQAERGLINTTSGGEAYLNTYVQHSSMGWRFIKQTPMEELLSDLRAARNTIILLVLLLVAALLFSDYVVSRMLSRPLEDLAKQARGLRSLLDEKSGHELASGELDEVEEAMRFVRTRLEQLEAGVEISEENAVRSVLQRFLESPLEPEMETELQREARERMREHSFIMVLGIVDRYRQLILRRGRARVDRLRSLAVNRLQEGTPGRCFAFMLRSDEILLLLESDTGVQKPERLREWIVSVEDAPGSFSFAYSPAPIELEGLRNRYESLQEAAMSRFFSGHHTLVDLPERALPTRQAAVYPQRTVERLVRHTLLGQEAEAMEAFDEAFGKLASDPAAVPLFSRLLVSSLYAEIRSRHGEELGFPVEFNRLRSYPDYADTFHELRRIIANTVHQIARELDSTTAKRHREVVEHATIIVGQEYGDPSLCDDAVAKRLGVSTQHLRSIYKQYHGSSLSKEITRLRLEEARRLLLTTSMAAKEVAESVGLGSANYFLTLFKKEFGMSPTSYRRRYTGARNGRNGGEE